MDSDASVNPPIIVRTVSKVRRFCLRTLRKATLRVIITDESYLADRRFLSVKMSSSSSTLNFAST